MKICTFKFKRTKWKKKTLEAKLSLLARKKIVTSFRRLRLISRETSANYALKIREGGRNGTKTTSPTWNSGIPECGAQIYSVEKLEDVD